MLLNSILFLCFLGITSSARILFITFCQSKSHVGSMTPLAQKLQAQGHEIGFYLEALSPIKIGHNFEDYQIKVDVESANNSTVFLNMQWNLNFRPIHLFFPFLNGVKTHKKVLKDHLSDYRKVSDHNWDLVFADPLFSVPAFEISTQLKVPYIVFHTTLIEDPFAYVRGTSWSAVTNPPFFMQHEIAETDWKVTHFWDRLDSAIQNLEFTATYLGPVQWMITSVIQISETFSFEKWFRGSSLSFLDYLDMVTNPTPMTPEMVITGGYCTLTAHNSLPEKLEKFVNDPKSKGTIMMAFGTVIQWEYAPKDRVNAIVTALNRLNDYRIIWGYKGPKLEIGDHVITMEWMPQADLLNHNKTELFVSHGGLKSFKETICANVPAVFLPIFAEQVSSAYLARSLGFGGILNKKILTADTIEKEIRGILTNPASYDNVRRTKSLWLDKIMNSLDLGAFWTNKVIKHGGMPAKYFKPNMKQYLFHSLYMDMFVLVFVIVYLSL